MKELITEITAYVSYFAQILAILVIVTGMIKAVIYFIKDVFLKQDSSRAIHESRLEMGHAFSLGLGFLIGASILYTVIAPTWDDIGKLAAIIAIRTLLNFFLTRELNIANEKMTEKRNGKKTNK